MENANLLFPRKSASAAGKMARRIRFSASINHSAKTRWGLGQSSVPRILQCLIPLRCPSRRPKPAHCLLDSRVTLIIDLGFSDCNEQEDAEGSKLPILTSSIVLVISTVAVAVCSDYLVDSVDGFVETLGVSKAFIGLIIVPIVGNAGEYISSLSGPGVTRSIWPLR